MSNAGPTPEDQLAFLGNIERLLLEGQFVASYKYALLLALVDLAVRLGQDDSSELDVPLDDIAQGFIELYWRQCAPYNTGVRDGDAGMLMQNTGSQAKLITVVDALRVACPSLGNARKSPLWQPTIRSVMKIVEDMPLWRLQHLRSGDCAFLYPRMLRKNCIRLKPGVAANLRRFHGFIVRMVESEWLRFIQSLPSNAHVLGPTADLEQFLFGSDRGRLAEMVAPLSEVQHGQCFYCSRNIAMPEVDHFVPWVRYPADLAYNLVLACRSCNQNKKDLLAAEAHLERWLIRNDRQAIAIETAGIEAGLVVDLARTVRVAEWAYTRTSFSEAAVWVAQDTTGLLVGQWHVLLTNTEQSMLP